MKKTFGPWYVRIAAARQTPAIPEENSLRHVVVRSNQHATALNTDFKFAEFNPIEDLVDRGDQLIRQELLPAAERLLRRALDMDAAHPVAHFKLANILAREGLDTNAEAHYRQAIAADPIYVKAHYNLGNCLKRQGKMGEAAECYQAALAVDPMYSPAECNLGVIYTEQKQYAQAEECYRHILSHSSGDGIVLANLALVLNEQGRHTEAESVCRDAMLGAKRNAKLLNNLGIALKGQGQLAEAVSAYLEALSVDPDLAEAHNNLAVVHRAQGHYEQAVASCRRALDINPGYTNAYVTLGNSLVSLGKFEESETVYLRALALNPEDPRVHNALGGARIALGKVRLAIDSFSKAVELDPDYLGARSNLIFTLNYTSAASAEERLKAALAYGKAAARQTSDRHTSWECTLRPNQLRVGLVSGDLREHPVGFFLESILKHIDSARIELIAYPTGRHSDDASTRIHRLVSKWKPIADLSDQSAAEMIHQDRLHLLIDLSGHTTDNRLPIFAYKPAPIQITWLGYFATTGVAEIDYILVDRTGVPETQQTQFSESVFYLPDTRLCFSPPSAAPPVAPLPALCNRHITFGCFQNLAKINDGVLNAWGEIFHRMPTGRLYVQSPQLGVPDADNEFLTRLARQGIERTRVTLKGAQHRSDYLAAHGKVDIILDTFPYPGGTTTCEALWMGVPTVTLGGNSLLERQGASLMSAAGLSDWIATDEENYIDKATTLAADTAKLDQLRQRLRQQAQSSPLFDAQRFAKTLEAALWDMWRSYENRPS